jgi:hypothetical protein
MGKKMNWAMYAEWSNSEQQCYKARSKQVELLSSNEEANNGTHLEEVCGQPIECTSTFQIDKHLGFCFIFVLFTIFFLLLHVSICKQHDMNTISKRSDFLFNHSLAMCFSLKLWFFTL